ncbi:MAG: SDR family NAD(P)-dependent oxidoreductase [Myxococcota bacterium]
MKTIHTALVTGANSGLGFEAAAQLAEQGASRVILACRNPTKAAAAAQALRERTGRDVFEVEVVDVSEVASASALAARLVRAGTKIDYLLLNASNDSLERVITEGGYELTLATNLVGHHVLTVDLVEGGALAAGARIVISTSEVVRRLVHDRLYDYDRLAEDAGSVRSAAVEVVRGRLPRKHAMMSAYSNAKMWAVWWALELSRRLPEGMAVFAVSPGVVPHTRDPKTLPWSIRSMMPLYRVLAPLLGAAWSVSDGARQYLEGAGLPVSESGAFYGAPPRRGIGKLERQTDDHYDNEPWAAAVWAALTRETGHALHRSGTGPSGRRSSPVH